MMETRTVIRANEKIHAFLDVKVIAMSGRSADELQKAKLLGARRTLQKPINLDELLRAIQYELQH